MLVHTGTGQAQQQKAPAQHAPEENIQALPMCWPVLRGMVAMLVHIGMEQAQKQKALAQHAPEENIQAPPMC